LRQELAGVRRVDRVDAVPAHVRKIDGADDAQQTLCRVEPELAEDVAEDAFVVSSLGDCRMVAQESFGDLGRAGDGRAPFGADEDEFRLADYVVRAERAVAGPAVPDARSLADRRVDQRRAAHRGAWGDRRQFRAGDDDPARRVALVRMRPALGHNDRVNYACAAFHHGVVKTAVADDRAGLDLRARSREPTGPADYRLRRDFRAIHPRSDATFLNHRPTPAPSPSSPSARCSCTGGG